LYAELEAELGIKLWYDLPLVRTLFNRGELNQWDVRSGDENYQKYTEDQPDLGAFNELTHPAFAYAGIRKTARVNIAKLVSTYREKLIREGRFLAAPFDYKDIDIKKEGNYNVADLTAEAMICCEGWRGQENPWFNYLPLGGAKGEVLRVKLAGPTPKRMLKHRIFLVPQEDDTFWVGATAENRFTNDLPTSENATYLEDRLKELVTVPYEIVNHQAAVRPTVKDRRPFLGRHPDYPNLIIFNGLGTKGTSVGPLCSKWLVEHLLEGKELPVEVDIERFAALR
jgi:glycine/D-amino acid oxidase-like deaminating enzyme